MQNEEVSLIQITAAISAEEQVEIDEMIQDLLGNSDIFMHDHSGNWAQGIIRQDGVGWLIWDMDERSRDDAAIAAFREGKDLPEGYYRLDQATATRIVHQGIFKHGIGFVQGDADAGMVDAVLQEVLLGEVIYC